jgi:Mn-containing catalase
MTREITHMKAFSAALESLEKPPFSIGRLAVTPKLVDEYFNASTGDGDEGDSDMRGPWQTSFGLHPVESQMNGGAGLSVGSVDGVAGYEARGKQDSGQKATTATKVKTVDKKSVPDNREVAQTGRQATMANEPITSR